MLAVQTPATGPEAGFPASTGKPLSTRLELVTPGFASHDVASHALPYALGTTYNLDARTFLCGTVAQEKQRQE
ncbi:hypothetical protein B0G76_3688 [Paraburkholderia sp. BL23I1N1]|nr:hypothetical protein B0G76_3688 [Paraburkholderia sp. BL23I1N1]